MKVVSALLILGFVPFYSCLAAELPAPAELLDPKAINSTLPAGLGTVRTNTRSYRLDAKLSGFSSTTNRPIQLEAWAYTGKGFILDGQVGYTGKVQIALTDARNPSDQSTLVQPVAASVDWLRSPTENGSDISPGQIKISKLGRWHTINITVPEILDETFPVTVHLGQESTGNVVEFSIARPQVELWTVPESIIGWGIGSGTVHARVNGMDHPEAYSLPLKAAHGIIHQGSVPLDIFGLGTTGLRSGLGGGSAIEVAGPGFSARSVQIDYRAPWLFFLAALAGSLAGVFATDWGRRHQGQALKVSAISAVVVCIVYALGIGWLAAATGKPGVAKAAEVVVFLLGVIGGGTTVTLGNWTGWSAVTDHPWYHTVSNAFYQKWEQLRPERTRKDTPTYP